ncbi:MAG: ABC transporter ATP-binding protein, partial [Rhizobium sp.]
YQVDTPIRVFVPTHKLFIFDSADTLVQAPRLRDARSA